MSYLIWFYLIKPWMRISVLLMNYLLCTYLAFFSKMTVLFLYLFSFIWTLFIMKPLKSPFTQVSQVFVFFYRKSLILPYLKFPKENTLALNSLWSNSLKIHFFVNNFSSVSMQKFTLHLTVTIQVWTLFPHQVMGAPHHKVNGTHIIWPMYGPE